MKRVAKVISIATATVVATGLGPAVAQADTVPATGTFTMTTAPGILPAWDSAGITLIGIAPGSATTRRFADNATVTLPVIAKDGTANATAGGFRITNTVTGDSVHCFIPTVDTRARVIDCLTSAGYNTAIFTIEAIDDRQKFATEVSRTTIFDGMDIRLTASGASTLNRELDATVFSTSVKVADGDLIVRRAR